MTAPETQRLFFALWPTEQVRNAIGVLRDGLPGLAGRPTVLEQVHQTLLFLGEVGEAQRYCLETMAGNMATLPFTVSLDRLGYWRRPEIAWLGASALPAPLAALAQGLRDGAHDCNVPLQCGPFAVHLTLQRKVRRRPAYVGPIAPILWPINEFVLVASRLRPAGPEYRVVRTWPFGSP